MVPGFIDRELNLKRTIRDKTRHKIYLLFEGENTEPLLINPIVSNNDYFKDANIEFRPFTKTENDKGLSSPLALIKKAKNKISELIRDKKFKSGYDKIIIFFDLDVFENNQTEMDKLLKEKTNDIILCYTNPSIELFILLSINNSFEEIIQPNESNILANNFVGKKRFILDLLIKKLKIDPKNHDANFSFILENMKNIIYQSRFLNTKLTLAANKLTCNIPYILEKLHDNKFDDIEY